MTAADVVSVVVIGREAGPCRIAAAAYPQMMLVREQRRLERPLEMLGRYDFPSRGEAERFALAVHEQLAGFHLAGDWFDVDATEALDMIEGTDGLWTAVKWEAV
jgi:hypothetical protein